MIIRTATPDDAAAIAETHVLSWRAAYKDILDKSVLDALDIESRIPGWRDRLAHNGATTTTIVAEQDGRVIGFAGYGPGDEPDLPADTQMLYSIYLHPTAMHQGVGSALQRAAELHMVGHASLRVLIENTPTRAFYERHGWSPEPGTERIERWYGADLHTIRYRKHIAEPT